MAVELTVKVEMLVRCDACSMLMFRDQEVRKPTGQPNLAKELAEEIRARNEQRFNEVPLTIRSRVFCGDCKQAAEAGAQAVEDCK